MDPRMVKKSKSNLKALGRIFSCCVIGFVWGVGTIFYAWKWGFDFSVFEQDSGSIRFYSVSFILVLYLLFCINAYLCTVFHLLHSYLICCVSLIELFLSLSLSLRALARVFVLFSFLRFLLVILTGILDGCLNSLFLFWY